MCSGRGAGMAHASLIFRGASKEAFHGQESFNPWDIRKSSRGKDKSNTEVLQRDAIREGLMLALQCPANIIVDT